MLLLLRLRPPTVPAVLLPFLCLLLLRRDHRQHKIMIIHQPEMEVPTTEVLQTAEEEDSRGKGKGAGR